MSSFDDRENAFESKFALDSELRFKATARRNRRLGHWAAELLGKSGTEAADYAAEVVAADFSKPGDDDVVEKVRADFDAAGIDTSDQEIRARMLEFLAISVEEVQKG